MTDALTAPAHVALLEQVLIGGDLATLTPAARLEYYRTVCASLGLNPLTKPFEYITLSGQLRLYARKDCTDQLRKLHGVAIRELDPRAIGDLFVVTVKAEDRTGRPDMATGAVAIAGLKGEALANAMMKAETKAKRRVTLSLCGLGMLDETEVETIPAAELPARPPAGVDLEQERHRAHELDTVPDEEWLEALGVITDPVYFRELWAYITQPVHWAKLSAERQSRLIDAKNAGKRRLGLE